MVSLKKNKNFKIVVIALLIFSIIFLAITCENNRVIKIGFSRFGRLPSIMCAVKSDKTQFDLNDVSLDFYYGGSNLYKCEGLVYEPVCVAVYFRNSRYKNSESIQSMSIEDYKEINSFYFVKEISFEQYNSGNYYVEIPRFSGIKFKHNERLTVPKEVISQPDGSFSFVVTDVYFSEKDNVYIFQTVGYVDIKYINIKGTTIKLSNP